MRRTLAISLEVEVSDLTRAERDQCAEIEHVDPKDLPRLKEVAPEDLSDLVGSLLSDASRSRELFEGTGLYVNFGRAKILASGWVP